MECKAIIFDLFETLITEWGHEKYTKRNMCDDIGVELEKFDIYWKEKEVERYLGNITFEDSIRYACKECSIDLDENLLTDITNKRMLTKSACFDYVMPEVYEMLDKLKNQGMKIALISNYSSEEVTIIKSSKLYPYFDDVILSYEVNLSKPDIEIYREAIKRLGVSANECLFVGDGGSHELEGAKAAGIKAIQAKWYTNQYAHKRESKDGFLIAEMPQDVLLHMFRTRR